MCARYSLNASSADLEALLDVSIPDGIQPRFNIAPTQSVLGVFDTVHGRELRFFRWGLVPSWAKDPAVGQRLINARAENAPEKPSFRTPFRKRRCIIPATSFFEWEHQTLEDELADDAVRDAADSGQLTLLELEPVETKPAKPAVRKLPHLFQLADGRPFGFAGLWDRWYDDRERPIETCTILTTFPNELVKPLHDRMPCILHEGDFAAWLDPGQEDPSMLTPLLVPYPAEEMRSFPVGTAVNSPRKEGPELLRPVV
jgi:putative SOS response-associated peptidase YedK